MEILFFDFSPDVFDYLYGETCWNNMKSRLVEYRPVNNLERHIDSYWFFRNNTGSSICFPVVPDGCSDIVFYLNHLNKLNDLEGPFVTGVMEIAKLVFIPPGMELFGIRFKPGILSFFLKSDMSKLKNKMHELQRINTNIFKCLDINTTAIEADIVESINSKLTNLLSEEIFKESFFKILQMIDNDSMISMNELYQKGGFSLKSIERMFTKRIGLPPKKFTRIMRFQRAHKKISKRGLSNLVVVALSSGYFDQAHFNREYKKLTGFNPNNETMSILYNT